MKGTAPTTNRSAREHASDATDTNAAAGQPEVKRTRKARLLDRITGLDKNSA